MSGVVSKGFQLKKIPIWKLGSSTFDKEEYKAQAKLVVDELDEYVTWLKEKRETTEKEITAYVAKQKKQKALELIRFDMCADNSLKMIDELKPTIESFQKNYKKMIKEEKVPKEFKKEVNTLLFLAERMSISSWMRVKRQLQYQYGKDVIEKVESGKSHIDEKIVTAVDYSPHERMVMDKYKQFESAWKKKLQEEEEELSIEELSDDVETESDTHIRDDDEGDDSDSDSDSDGAAEVKKEKKSLKQPSKKDKKKEEKKKEKKESSDSESDSSSEEEKKPAKKEEKKPAKKDSSDSESDSSSEEEKKPAKKEEAKKKKESSSDSDSSSSD